MLNLFSLLFGIAIGLLVRRARRRHAVSWHRRLGTLGYSECHCGDCSARAEFRRQQTVRRLTEGRAPIRVRLLTAHSLDNTRLGSYDDRTVGEWDR